MATACSSTCEDALHACVKSSSSSPADAYSNCLTSELVSSGKCAAGCAPTYAMLTSSELPTLNLTAGSSWGKPATSGPRPSTSICSA